MSPRLAALAALLGLACASSDPWTFGVSRAAYEDGGLEELFEGADGDVDPAGACAAAFLLALPIALDVLFLPVALPHDFVVHGAPGG